MFGLEGDLDWSNVRGNSACGVGQTCETRNTWLGTARGRVATPKAFKHLGLKTPAKMGELFG